MPKKIVKKGKRKRKPKKPSKRWLLYKIGGSKAVPTNRFCPRCGPGVFLARHGNRLYCGKCHYAEFLNKEQAKEETKKTEAEETKKTEAEETKEIEEIKKE